MNWLKVLARRLWLIPGPCLMITRGLPGCGKTTWARSWVAEDPARRIRTSRDDLRDMMHGGYSADTELLVVQARNAIIRDALRRGLSVVCDETNLPRAKADALKRLGRRYGAISVVMDLTCIPLEVCLARNAARPGATRVPEAWIHDQHARHVIGDVP